MLFYLVVFIYVANVNAGGVDLSDINSLIFQKGKMTYADRLAVRNQLQCVGGNACGDHEPDIIQCTNIGWSGFEYQWKCDTSLPTGYVLGTTTVRCEGYESRDDPKVLSGSCGLEYTLNYKSVEENNNFIIFAILILILFIAISLTSDQSNNRHHTYAYAYPPYYDPMQTRNNRRRRARRYNSSSGYGDTSRS